MLVNFTPNITREQDPFRDIKPDSPALHAYLREILGPDEHPLAREVHVEVQRLDPWVFRESFADDYIPDPNVFLLGDAAHRHPPVYVR